MINQKENQLEKLKLRLVAENPLPELEAQATQLVFGSGSCDAEIVMIGEAPGKKEDITGEPFVGSSGRFLNEMLESANINREDVYITNIVKYRPPGNRDPLAQEKLAMWPYLIEQIKIIEPKFVVTLGNHSGKQFLPDLQISRDHGVPVKLKMLKNKETNITVLPLYHPAAALYNGALRQTLIDDFKQVAKLIK